MSHNSDRPTSIMVVEDVPATLALLAGMLRRQGYEVRPFPRGQLALTSARTEPPDLILLDIDMPEMDGYEVCAALKADPVTVAIPVLFISASEEVVDKVRAFAAGGVDYIAKPFEFAEVQARITTHLRLRRLQSDLVQSYSQLRELESLRDSLVHMMVHDMRSPLQILLSFVEDAELLAREAADPEIREALCVAPLARRSIETLRDMISSTLDTSRLEAGDRVTRREELDLGQLALAAADGVGLSPPTKRVSVDLPAEPAITHGDRDMLRRVLQNLVSNAIKFAPHGSRLVQVVIQRRDGLLRAEVRDNGPGVPDADRRAIFEKFSRVRRRQAGESRSTGLGLAFCKLAVEAHRGTIGVAGRPEGGSIFWFEIPIVGPAAAAG